MKMQFLITLMSGYHVHYTFLSFFFFFKNDINTGHNEYTLNVSTHMIRALMY